MGVGLLALLAAELAATDMPAAEIARVLEERRGDIDLYVALDTLEYLRKGGRISGAQATIGSLLSVKPIITVRGGKVETADRVRTRSKARARVLELLSARPLDRLAVLYTPPADGTAVRDELVAHAARRHRSRARERAARRLVGRAAPGARLHRRGGAREAGTKAPV